MRRDERENLAALLEEKALGPFERRRRRMIEAQKRLEILGYSLSEIFAIAEDSKRLAANTPLRRDVYSVLNLGFVSDEEFDAELARKQSRLGDVASA